MLDNNTVNLLSIMTLGATPVLINNSAKSKEIQHMMSNSKADILWVPRSQRESMVDQLKSLRAGWTFYSNNSIGISREMENEEEFGTHFDNGVHTNEQGTILYTSGTTSLPVSASVLF